MLYQLSYSRGVLGRQKYDARANRASQKGRKELGRSRRRINLPMANVLLSPGTRRLLGWMFFWTGALLGLGQALRLGIAAYAWSKGGLHGGREIGLVLLYVVGLGVAGLLARYGLQLLRASRLPNGPGRGPRR
jgi:hypothetical protein